LYSSSPKFNYTLLHAFITLCRFVRVYTRHLVNMCIVKLRTRVCTGFLSGSKTNYRHHTRQHLHARRHPSTGMKVKKQGAGDGGASTTLTAGLLCTRGFMTYGQQQACGVLVGVISRVARATAAPGGCVTSHTAPQRSTSHDGIA
jgi:hypothetical protein